MRIELRMCTLGSTELVREWMNSMWRLDELSYFIENREIGYIMYSSTSLECKLFTYQRHGGSREVLGLEEEHSHPTKRMS